ncbi:MAG: glycosyltransferase family 2 protein, partial [Boseongicola sp.]|nr:glycosyltransferase family 2 protein [Boseongicola sp.]
RGKVAVLTDLKTRMEGGIAVLTDVSAMFARDALSRLAQHFWDPKVGAVSGGYRLSKSSSLGQRFYWQYQSAVKRGESRLAGLMGAHGALYAVRASCLRPLEADTINDDFVIPVRVAIEGWRTLYDPAILVEEQETLCDRDDGFRRRRIGAGNLQQLLRLLPDLIARRQTRLAFSLVSGKGLRVLMGPLLIIAALAAIAALSSEPKLALIAVLTMVAATRLPILSFIINGHLQSMFGAILYLCGDFRRWSRTAAAISHSS